MRLHLVSPLLALALACHGHGNGFATFQACYDEHHTAEALTVLQSITVCCLDHPIDGVTPACGDTQAACEAYVDAELDPSVTAAEITMACEEYFIQQGL